jgi:hypothetical protein
LAVSSFRFENVNPFRTVYPGNAATQNNKTNKSQLILRNLTIRAFYRRPVGQACSLANGCQNRTITVPIAQVSAGNKAASERNPATKRGNLMPVG